MTDRLLSTADFMQILGCKKSFANNLLHMFDARNQLYRCGRLLRVKESDFKAWLEECKRR